MLTRLEVGFEGFSDEAGDPSLVAQLEDPEPVRVGQRNAADGDGEVRRERGGGR